MSIVMAWILSGIALAALLLGFFKIRQCDYPTALAAGLDALLLLGFSAQNWLGCTAGKMTPIPVILYVIGIFLSVVVMVFGTIKLFRKKH